MPHNFLKTEGFLLRSIDYSEADRIITFFTQEKGKISAIAKGVRRIKSKMGGHLEFFNKIQVDLYKSESQQIYLIQSAEQRTLNKNFMQDLELIEIGFQILKTLNKFIEENYPLPKIFNLLDQTLFFLNKKQSPEILISTFELKLFSILGYIPPLENCIRCKKKLSTNSHFYHLEHLGIICQDCHSSFALTKSIDFNSIKILNFLQKGHLEDIIKIQITKEQLQLIQNILHNFKMRI